MTPGYLMEAPLIAPRLPFKILKHEFLLEDRRQIFRAKLINEKKKPPKKAVGVVALSGLQ
jgi:hypothetical protein